jgi:hypothetical protein
MLIQMRILSLRPPSNCAADSCRPTDPSGPFTGGIKLKNAFEHAAAEAFDGAAGIVQSALVAVPVAASQNKTHRRRAARHQGIDAVSGQTTGPGNWFG